MKAVVMAGGEGTRLRPLTCNRPKPLVPLCNKPVMEYIIELLRDAGITQIVVTLHYLADEIVSYFGDGSEWGVQIMYSVEDEPLGTAGSVKMVEDYLDDTFIIISGDSLTDFNLPEIIKFHKEKKSLATITLTRVDNPLEFGVVITQEDGAIRRFLEKPSWGEVFSDTINTGIYVIEPEVLKLMQKHGNYDWSKDIFPKLLEDEKPLYGYVTNGYWCDIGNIQQYRNAQVDMIQGKVKVNLPGEKLGRNIWLGENAEVHPSAKIEGPAVIGKNCRIKENAQIDEYTILGDNCIIEDSSVLHRSVLWNNVYIGKNNRMSGAIICRQNTIKNNVVINEGAVLGDKVFIGSGAVVQPQVKVWPDKNIEAGATVNMSLIWGVKWPGSLFSIDGISGLANIEITPEFALKLGAAYGAYLAKGSAATTSRDSHPASRMLNRAIICGLSSVGVDCYDLRVNPTPVSRFVLKDTGAKGGIHTRVDPRDPRNILIEFYDEKGININKSIERKLENIFFREDFRRTSMDEVGSIEFPARAIDSYNDGFFNNLDAELIRKTSFKVILSYGFGMASLVLPHILGKLDCETISINAYLDAQQAVDSMMKMEESLTNLRNIVTTLNADIGVRIDMDCEKLIVIDDKGHEIADNRLLALFTHLVLKHLDHGIVAVPITAPSVIEGIAHKHGGKVIVTKSDGRSLMHTASLGEQKIAFAGHSNGSFIFPSFHSSFDAMFAFSKLLEFMAKEKRKLSEILEELPEFHMAQTTVDCTWQEKGKIMRLMIELHEDKPIEVIEGLKIFFDKAWVLMLPDPATPAFHLFAEADTDEEARKLLGEIKQTIERLKEDAPVRVEENKTEEREALEKVRKESKENGDAKEPAKQKYLSVERAFHFWIPGKYLGVKARSFKEFVDAIHYIDAVSIDFHMNKGDFANWLEYELDYPRVAEKIRALKDDGLQGEALRDKLTNILS
ncbi:MAG: NTP transferase domain-containing protein [Firmicutes bacterium]|nr:NTP transferase domain-containing protein [Bacillota bacterium]